LEDEEYLMLRRRKENTPIESSRGKRKKRAAYFGEREERGEKISYFREEGKVRVTDIRRLVKTRRTMVI